ncbi:hypothetical protein [Virgibacillus halodenitrificans]|uniref:hypothetical protein n=1 Tax=Virgibacillus halodenitrificans TaxID=1482 RepID=UPI0002EEC2F9|nr:hypothetical protein [Virgibacillus halodenitrificans]
MNRTWLLMKTILKMHYSRAGKSNSQIGLLVVAALFLIPLVFFYLSSLREIINTLYDALNPLGQETVIIGLLFVVMHVLLFFMSFITVLSAFYFAEDIISFLPYPFHGYQLLLGKSAQPFIYLYITSAAIYLPAFVYYGNAASASFFYYIIGFILFILLPIIPFSIASILLMFVMRFVNITKNKERSKIIAGIASLSFIILINVVVRLNTNTEMMMQDVASYIQEKDGLLKLITSFYPPAYFSTMALASGGLLFFLGILILTGIAFLLFICLGQIWYIKGLLGTGNKKSHKKTTGTVSKHIKKRSVWLSYIRKELLVIFRTPTFLMNCVIQSLFAPVFLFIIFMLDSGTSVTGMMDIFSTKEQLLVLFLASMFILGANATSYTSLSREGKDWNSNLFLPLQPKQIFYSKIAVAWIINLIPIGLILAACIFAFKLSFTLTFIWLIIVLLSSWFTSMLGTYLDLDNPKLNWTDEQEVFKTRMIGLIAVIIEIGLFGLLVLLVWNISFIQGLYLTSGILLILLVTAILIIDYLLKSKLKQNAHQRI